MPSRKSSSPAVSLQPNAGVICDPAAIEVFERCPLGIVQINTKLEILYANKSLLDMVGLRSYSGLSVTDLLPTESCASFGEHFRKRLEGASEDYEMQFMRQDGVRVPISIAAMPVTKAEGPVTGAIAIVRNLTTQKAIEALDKRIETGQTAQEILGAISEELDKLMPYDLCVVSVFEDDLKRVRVLFTRRHSGEVHWPARWFEISPAAIDWVRQQKIEHVPDYQAFVQHERWQGHRNPKVAEALGGMKSMLRIPIVRKDRVVASLQVYRSELAAFRQDEIEIVRALPLQKAVLVALSYLEAEELRFRNELVDKLAKHKGIDVFDKSIAELIARRLAEHYDWDAVAVFKVNQEKLQFELQAQASQPGVSLPTQPLTQHIDEGVLGYAYRNNTRIVVGDLRNDPQFGNIYKSKWLPATVSELCMPITADREIVGFLNIEDSRRDAFSEGETAALGELMSEVGSMLEGRKNANIASAAFMWTPSALFVVAADCKISKVNPTTADLLQYSEQELRGRPLQDVLEPADLVPSVLRDGSSPRDDLRMIRKDGRRLKVILASSQLGQGMGTILSAKEISSRQRLEELDFLSRLFYEVSAQTKMPLSLALEWLRRLRQQFGSPSAPLTSTTLNTLDKAIRQLRKIDITYERLVLYDKDQTGGLPRNPVIIRIERLLAEIRDELPLSDSKRLRIGGNALARDIEADTYQLSFVLLATLSYALRFLPEDRKLQINVNANTGDEAEWVAITVDAVAPPLPAARQRNLDRSISQAINEIALGSSVIEAFVKENGGRYQPPEKLEGEVEFRFEFPAARMAA